MKDFGNSFGFGNCLFDGGKNQVGVMIFTHLHRNDLSRNHILDGDYIPPPPCKWDETNIGAPQLIGSGRYPLLDEVVVRMVTREFGTEIMDFPPGRMDAKQPHYPGNAFVIDGEMPAQS